MYFFKDIDLLFSSDLWWSARCVHCCSLGLVVEALLVCSGSTTATTVEQKSVYQR